jgi:glycerol-3-phosphate acyltransferase PlsY
MSIVSILLSAYLLGSIPFGLLIGLARGIDVRTVGSRNIGATNVLRTVGKPWGILAFVLDFAKGLAGALLAPALANAAFGETWPAQDIAALAGGLAAVAGHTWPVWLGFRGGKGVATSAGMLVAVAPAEVGIAFAVWLAVLIASRYVSLASISAAVALAAAAWLRAAPSSPREFLIPGLITILALVVVLRHRANIARLMAGTENRFQLKG